jgi:predicted permease
MWTDIRQDVRYAIRGLRRAPGFTGIAVLTLALGIGANTAIFSVIDAALLRPLPFPEAGQLVFLWNTHHGTDLEPLGPGRMLDFRAESTSFGGFAGISHMSFTLTGSGEPERISGSSVSSTFFDVLGVRPLLGEPFHSNAADPTAVVLTERLWRRRFSADPSIIRRNIVLNGRARHVLAVMPRELAWPSITARQGAGDTGPELWVPGGPGDVPRPAVNEDADMTGYRNTGYLRAVARLKPGVPFGQARAEIAAIGDRLSRTHAEDDGRGATLVTIREQLAGSIERPLLVLAGAVAFVLAIACANVASLVLGRGAARRRDLALRRAIGASRMRIFRQLLTESLVLACAGAAGGLLFAWWAARSLLQLAPPDFASVGAAIDVRVLFFTLAVAVVVGVAFGIIPAFQLSRDSLTDALGEGSARASGSGRSRRTRDALVVAEIAVALVLLLGSTLLIRSLMALTRVDTGIDTRNLLTFDVSVSGPRAEYQARQVQFYSDVLERLRAVPGVRAAGAAVTLPIGGDDFGTGYLIEGRSKPKPVPHAGYQIVMPGYFDAMGIPIKTGRDFRFSDTRDSAPVVLVNETLARDQWPGEDPVGRRVRFDDDAAWMTVVGVVGDIRHLGPSSPPRPELYQAVTQRSFPFIAFVVRTEADPYTSVPSLRRAVAAIDPDLPLSNVRTMDDHIARALARPAFLSTLVSSFGVLAVLLAIVGVYGMMSWSVAERRREIAIRMALGASRPEMLGMVLRRAVALAAVGIGGGLFLAPLAAQVLTGLLYGIRPTDPLSLAGTAVALAMVAILAAVVPAVRASRIEPAGLMK